MATCPKCGGQMKATEIICPHCGYDFPLQDRSVTPSAKKTGIAYSGLADIALYVGMVITAIGSIISFIGIVILTSMGRYVEGLIQAPLSFLTSFALFVVFQRVADMD